jgi:hypothetical protein
MNQTQKSQLVLSAVEARNIQADIFSLLTQIADLSSRPAVEPTVTQLGMDGGSFK